jgi:hypothetical protein
MTITTHDDPLTDLFVSAGSSAPRQLPERRMPADFVPAVERIFTEACPKCRGSGRWGYRQDRECFGCKGTGKLSFKTSYEERAKGRAKAAEKRQDRAAELRATVDLWHTEHEAEGLWLTAKAGGTWEFPSAMLEALNKWGSLTENQLAAVRKCMARDVVRTETRRIEAQARQEAAPTIDIRKIETAFESARANAAKDGEGVKWLKLRLGSPVLTFSPAGANSKNPGAIYVKADNGDYLGKVVNGKFFGAYGCTDTQKQQIIAVAADPAAAATAYGLRTGECSCCGRELTNTESRRLGIGPICRERYGW